jgi:hypothetical protein
LTTKNRQVRYSLGKVQISAFLSITKLWQRYDVLRKNLVASNSLALQNVSKGLLEIYVNGHVCSAQELSARCPGN